MSAGARRRCAAEEARLYRELQPRLLAQLRARISAPEQTLEDACSFAWVQFITDAPDHDGIARWLYVVAFREALRIVRRDGRVASISPDRLSEHAALVFDEQRDDARDALEALASLPVRQRDLLAGHVAGYSYRELVAREGSSYTAVNRHLARAHAAIRHTRGANSGG